MKFLSFDAEVCMSGSTFHGPPSRRTVLKTAAIGGVGLAAWTVPVVEVFSMTASNAEAVSGPPTPPTFSVDPTSVTAPPESTPPGSTPPGGGGLGGGGDLGAGGLAAPKGGSRGQLASTGVNLPVGTTTAVAVGAIAAGAAAVVLGNRASSAPAVEAAGDSTDLPQGPRRH